MVVDATERARPTSSADRGPPPAFEEVLKPACPMVARAVRKLFPHIAVRVSAPPGLGQQMAKIFVSQPGGA